MQRHQHVTFPQQWVKKLSSPSSVLCLLMLMLLAAQLGSSRCMTLLSACKRVSCWRSPVDRAGAKHPNAVLPQELAAECAAAEALAQEVETLVNQGPQDDQAPAEAAGVANAAAAPDPQQAAHHTLDSQPQQSAPRQLWVDKYAPKSFLQLLSEPRTNREIATWMAKWKQPQSGQQQAAPQHQQQKQQQHAAGNSRFSGGDKRQQQGGRGYGRGSGAGRGSGGGGNFATGFDAARYQAAQAARAAAKMLLVVGPPGETGCRDHTHGKQTDRTCGTHGRG